MTIEEIFEEARIRGLRLNNFAQLADGVFHANFRIDDGHNEIWFAPISRRMDPREALHDALKTALSKMPKKFSGVQQDLFG